MKLNICGDFQICISVPLIQLKPGLLRILRSKHSSRWRRLEDALKMSFVFIFLIKTNIVAIIIRLPKTSSRRLQDVLMKTNIFVLAIRLQKVLPRRLQDVLQKRFQGIFKTFCQDVFKTSSRRLRKTSSKHLQDVFQRCLPDVFKTYHQVKDLPRFHFWEIYDQCRKFASVIKISQVLA